MTKRPSATKKAAKKKSATVENKENELISHIGQRCEEIRNSLNISRAEMGTICGGFTYQAVLSFEKSQVGSVTLLTNYLTHLYEVARINPAWILLRENKHISKHVRTYAEIAKQVKELTQGVSVDGI
jgi:hypothetical protein